MKHDLFPISYTAVSSWKLSFRCKNWELESRLPSRKGVIQSLAFSPSSTESTNSKPCREVERISGKSTLALKACFMLYIL